jgi:2-amino-4-hydroxy-6-hydroxymethyldihydropteridine diphosphokinase
MAQGYGFNNTALCLGSNAGERAFFMHAMVAALQLILEPPFLFSLLMETESLPRNSSRRWYLNRIITGRFYGSAPELLRECSRIETNLGRRRPYKNSPRTADIDILLFNGCYSAHPGCTIPHPRMLERRFCLEGLVQVAPDWVVPGTNQCVAALHKKMSPEIRRQNIIFMQT